MAKETVDQDEKVRFTLPINVAEALDAFYKKARLPRSRPIRRLPTLVGKRQEMITTRFVLDVIEAQALPDELLEQTIYRLATAKKGRK